MSPNVRIKYIILIAWITGTAAVFQAHSAPPPSEVLAPVKLRGFGTVSARYWNPPQLVGASIIRVSCETPQKAQILQAKYLSDLQLLPGVMEVKLPDGTAAFQIVGQGIIASVRTGSRVYLLTARTPVEMSQVLDRDFLPKGQTLVSRAGVPVPMFLDRWDRFGFRFYYRPWEMPKGQTLQTYDVPAEFDYANQQQRSGFVFWDDENRLDTAEGLMN